jgi:hypothetical protein
MSGESIEVLATSNVQVLESAGIGIANGALVMVSNTYDKMATSGGGNGYPDGQFVLEAAFGVAPVENGLLSLYAREYPANGAVRTDTPEATRPGRSIGSFVVNDRTGPQTMILMVENLPPKADYYIHNNGTGQAVSSGWKLSVVPRTFRPAP